MKKFITITIAIILMTEPLVIARERSERGNLSPSDNSDNNCPNPNFLICHFTEDAMSKGMQNLTGFCQAKAGIHNSKNGGWYNSCLRPTAMANQHKRNNPPAASNALNDDWHVQGEKAVFKNNIEYIYGTAIKMGWDEETLRQYIKMLELINKRERGMRDLTDKQLKAKTVGFKQRLEKGNSLDDILVEAFAVVREAARRTIGQRPHDVQVLAAIALHHGKAVEMFAGEGKTLSAVMPAYLNALTGKGAQIHTVNDYLAKRDAQNMGPIYDFLGLKTTVITPGQCYVFDKKYSRRNKATLKNLRSLIILKHDRAAVIKVKQQAYRADIVYGPKQLFVFDYLFDNAIENVGDRVQREERPEIEIVDEVDSVLVDESTDPLIISQPESKTLDSVSAPSYMEDLKRKLTLVYNLSKQLVLGRDYTLDSINKRAALTEVGKQKIDRLLKNVPNLKVLKALDTSVLYKFIASALVRDLYHEDVHFIIKDEIRMLIIDEYTGRTLPDHKWPDGLHQLVQLREECIVDELVSTLAFITYKNYYRRARKLAAMSGTIGAESAELKDNYGLETAKIPLRLPLQGEDLPIVVLKTEQDKWEAILKDVKENHAKGRPILIGTASIRDARYLEEKLEKNNIECNVLTGVNTAWEEDFLSIAGQPGVVTIVTQIGGRGVDIALGPGVEETGGLYVIGSSLLRNRRLEDQLRRRAGRQGEPGSSIFYVSLDEELVQLFGDEDLEELTQNFGKLEEADAQQIIRNIQKRIEEHKRAVRHTNLRYDDALDQTRGQFYHLRGLTLKFSDRRSVQNRLRPIDDLWMNYLKALEDLKDKNKFAEYVMITKLFAEDLNELTQNFGKLEEADAQQKISNIQKKIEEHKRAVRHATLRYDDALGQYREKLYHLRGFVLKYSDEKLVKKRLRQIDNLWVNYLNELEDLEVKGKFAEYIMVAKNKFIEISEYIFNELLTAQNMLDEGQMPPGVYIEYNRAIIIVGEFKFSIQTDSLSEAIADIDKFKSGEIERIDFHSVVNKFTAEVEKYLINRALRQAEGDRKLAANLLGAGYSTIVKRIEEYGLRDMLRLPGEEMVPISPEGINFDEVSEEQQKDLIIRALAQTMGKRQRAAILLEIGYRKFKGRMRKFGIKYPLKLIEEKALPEGVKLIEVVDKVAAEVEKELIRAALVQAQGNNRLGAKLLGVSYSTFRRLEEKHSLKSAPNFLDKNAALLPAEGIKLEEVLEKAERELLIRAITYTKGNMNEAAKLLSISPEMLSIKMNKYRLQYTQVLAHRELPPFPLEGLDLREEVKRIKKDYDIMAFEQADGNARKAARLLNVAYLTLYQRLRSYRLITPKGYQSKLLRSKATRQIFEALNQAA